MLAALIIIAYGFACLTAGIAIGRKQMRHEIADAMREAKARAASRRNRPE